MCTAPEAPYDIVIRYKRSFPLLMKGLDIDYMMLDEIDNLPPGQLTYTIVQPVDLDNEAERSRLPKAFKNCRFIYAPVSRKEVVLLVETLEPYILQKLSHNTSG